MENKGRMKIKGIALDLDGTTLNGSGRLSEKNREALIEAIRKGIHIVVASGRAYDTLPEDILKVPGIEYAVTGNGAAMYHLPSGKCLHRYRLKKEDVQAIAAETMGNKVTYEVFVDGNAYADKNYVANPAEYGATPHGAEYIRRTRRPLEDIHSFLLENAERMDSIDIVVKEAERKEEIRKRIEDITKEVYITSSSDHLLEISHRSAGKHSGLKIFMEMLGLQWEEVAAFGDADNDAEMLLFAGCGIAMGNASDRCKEVADFITENHEEDGVAYGLREILHVI